MSCLSLGVGGGLFIAKMVKRHKASFNVWLFSYALVIAASIRASFSFGLDPGLLKVLDVPNSIPVSYREIKNELDGFKGLPAATGRFSLSSLSPFCTKFTIPDVAADVVPECIRWEVSLTSPCLLVHILTSQAGLNAVIPCSDNAFYYRCHLWHSRNKSSICFSCT